ncbi:broad-complex core protein isoforms 1/2/3/4/5 isoform X5 [Halyomorpha halys]|uniref:broad-complex core protein isoforms 1/2/3/4/5 isoform X5 n=1 Tax=Halyomorpha halys TaxID=286706 RepID=UPI0006D4EBE8|nr:broad-complex core protein isoforms 1/2/3/4/5 isoform X4 [Halyomorpha halys]
MRGTMGDMQHFCLRWNNYQSSITSAFENLRDDEDFVDVTLACDGKSLKAHRVVLSACSPYFRELLKSTPCKHPVIVLQDVMFEDLHALVEFIYHGEVNVRQRSLSSFLKTAEVLRVSGLTQQSGAVSMGLDKGANLADGRGSPHHPRKPQHKHRERPVSTPENLESQDSSLPKRPKNEPNSYPERSPLMGGDMEEPPMDFSTTSGNNNNNNNNNNNSREKNSGSPAGSDIKPEPIELTPHIGNEKDDSGDSGGEMEAGPPHLPPQLPDPDDSMPSAHNYLDSKLFAGPGFQFSMAAALAADSLAGLNNQAHALGNSDGLAGTSSQGVWQRPGRPVACHRPNNDHGYTCDICHKRYRTISSLRNHKSVYHRQNRAQHDKRYPLQQQQHQPANFPNPPPPNFHYG